MTATINFNLDNFEEYSKMRRMLTADDLYSILWDIKEQKLRSWWKYDADPVQTLEQIRDLIIDSIDFDLYQ